MAKKILILFFLFLGICGQNIVGQAIAPDSEYLKKAMTAEQQGDYARAAALLCKHYYTHFDNFSRHRLQLLSAHYGLRGYDFLNPPWWHIPARYFNLLALLACLLFLVLLSLLVRQKKLRYLLLCWLLTGGAAWFFYTLPPKRLAIVKAEALLGYQHPTVAAPLLATLPRGTCLRVIDEQPFWWKVYTPQGQTVYVQKSMVYLIEAENKP
ncbi:MAG: hypothetical protein KatS3mg033_1557 [Thermonema sp.]|uniref:SH3 domain-containing protein n=1 Tax=Thermonema sp. TaxID=2231181 RepID=UPI0021DE8B73|nr:SH3 domain-containing protein [Thermonema sp.]GIV39757.1 MAG: hypothetical protein KatS3mg033_1557 [Thermonema sp.]